MSLEMSLNRMKVYHRMMFFRHRILEQNKVQINFKLKNGRDSSGKNCLALNLISKTALIEKFLDSTDLVLRSGLAREFPKISRPKTGREEASHEWRD